MTDHFMAKLTKDEIISRLTGNKARIKAFGVTSIALFGSYAHGASRENSDLDFLVEFEDGRGLFDDYFGLLEFLQFLFETEKIDLVKKKLVRKELRKTILEGEQYAAQI